MTHCPRTLRFAAPLCSLQFAMLQFATVQGPGHCADWLAVRRRSGLKAAADNVAPSVVQIRTIGGLDAVDGTAAGRRANHRTGHFGRWLHHFQRVQFRPAARLDPRHLRLAASKLRPSWSRPTTAACWCCLKCHGVTDLPGAHDGAARRDPPRPVGRLQSVARSAPIGPT